MAYDFDWVGESLAIGDEEAQTFVLPIEPSGNQQGADSPGMLSGHSDFVNYGLWNGNFRLGPPDPTANLDVASSTSGSNFLPHWRFVQSSNTNITAKQVRDASSPSGSNLRFTFVSGAAADAAYVEQIVDIGGDRFQSAAEYLRAAVFMPTGSGGRVTLRAQYLTVDGSIAGMPAEATSQVSPGSTVSSLALATVTATAMPSNAARLRIRIEASRASGTGALTLDIANIRRDRALPYPQFPDTADPVTYIPGRISQTNGVLVGSGQGLNSTWRGLIGPHLVPLEFIYNNIPAGATTELLPSDNNMSLGGVPRVILPWDCSIVGMSYRLSGAPTAGTINLQATVGGSNVWSPFGALGTGASTGDALSQAPGTDTVTAGTGIGVQAVTSGGYLPTTRHIHVVLWLAVNYLGS